MNDRSIRFSKLGLGLFVHYGIYSTLGEGEWVKLAKDYSDSEYDSLVKKFNPRPDFADNLCKFAIRNGFKYIVLTTRHHDGFSLYDTKGLNEFDAVNYIGRDIVREFVDSCREYKLIPILYHTLIDWREEKKYDSFSKYLKYLRESIDLLLTNYGEIGGIWFDGQWKYPNADWEEDKLYGLIRKKQPNAVIVNNAGLSRLGERFSNYLDVVTYERSNILNYDYNKSINSYAAEMCQALNVHWGYARKDINYKSIKDILFNFCTCRKFGGNLLLNVGPVEDGSIRPIEKEMIDLLGEWINTNAEAVFDSKPYPMELPDNTFALSKDNCLYIVIMDIPMEIDENAGRFEKNPIIIELKNINYNKVYWLDNHSLISLNDNKINVEPFEYGTNMLARVIKIEL